MKHQILLQRLAETYCLSPSVSSSLILNPSAQVKLSKDTLGFFIAESPQAVKRYCTLQVVSGEDTLDQIEANGKQMAAATCLLGVSCH